MPIYKGDAPCRIYKGDALAQAVYVGDIERWRRVPAYVDVSTSGDVSAPTWACLADVGVIGGGGGGASGDNGFSTANGEGGNAAVWQTQTLVVQPGDVLTFTIGGMGTGGTGTVRKSGTAGGTSSVVGPGGFTLSSVGGTPGIGTTANMDSTGHGAALVTNPNGATFPASASVAVNTVGNAPGGGGGGGAYPGVFGSVIPGRNGGGGMGRVRWRSY